MKLFRNILVAFILIIIVSIVTVFLLFKFGGLKEKIIFMFERKLDNALVQQNTSTTFASGNIIQEILGFNKPHTYLFLFLNNTELRPGGGFIGAYGVVKMEKGSPAILKLEGTELLDLFSTDDFVSVPPEPLAKYLKIKRLEFRDSNWSPDFASSSSKSLELYDLEKGVASKDIDAVIGITPTLLEEILRISGPVVINNEKYTADNFTEKLEYEVEYGYAQRGLSKSDRKQELEKIARVLIDRLKYDAILHWSKYFSLVQRMLDEKQIIVYATNPTAQAALSAKNWTGELNRSAGDYLLWVDANLSALKTDASIVRELEYSITPSSSENFVATAKMKYYHRGKMDWRTTRYRDYARIFVPLGSKFISASGSLKSSDPKKTPTIDWGIENGKQWFGTFISIDPGKEGELVWKYYLSPTIVAQVKSGQYSLYAQKQLGTVSNKLTFDLDFGKKISTADPAEEQKYFGDNKFNLVTDLRVDKEIEISF